MVSRAGARTELRGRPFGEREEVDEEHRLHFAAVGARPEPAPSAWAWDGVPANARTSSSRPANARRRGPGHDRVRGMFSRRMKAGSYCNRPERPRLKGCEPGADSKMSWCPQLPPRASSVGRRLTLITVLASALALALALGSITVSESIAFRAALRADVGTLADVVSANTAAALVVRRPAERRGHAPTRCATAATWPTAAVYNRLGARVAYYARTGRVPAAALKALTRRRARRRLLRRSGR